MGNKNIKKIQLKDLGRVNKSDYYAAPNCNALCSSGSGTPKANGTQECECSVGLQAKVTVSEKIEDHDWKVNDSNSGSYKIHYIKASGSSNGYTFDISYVYYTGTCYRYNPCSAPHTTISTSLLPTPTSKDSPVYKLRVTVNGKTAIATMKPGKVGLGSKRYQYNASWSYGTVDNYFGLKKGQSVSVQIDKIN